MLPWDTSESLDFVGLLRDDDDDYDDFEEDEELDEDYDDEDDEDYDDYDEYEEDFGDDDEPRPGKRGGDWD